jgi:regulator of protease activity HflC (stomatin/prohibitin superfamily)
MANTDNPAGATPVMHRNGGPYNGAFRIYSVAAGDGTALMIGDFVKLAGTAQTLNGRVLQDVVRAATGDVMQGVVVGVAPATQDSLIYRAASTLREVYVADDPDLIFEIQEGSSGTALTANDAGLNIDFVVAAGSTVTGRSGTQINNATEATTNTLDLHLLSPVSRQDNEIGYSCKWLVTINRHQFSNQTAGV